MRLLERDVSMSDDVEKAADIDELAEVSVSAKAIGIDVPVFISSKLRADIEASTSAVEDVGARVRRMVSKVRRFYDPKNKEEREIGFTSIVLPLVDEDASADYPVIATFFPNYIQLRSASEPRENIPVRSKISDLRKRSRPLKMNYNSFTIN